MSTTVDPEHIMQIGMGFMASKTLLSAVEFEVFSVIGSGSATAKELEPAIGLHGRGSIDFLDALASLGLLERDGSGPTASYRNTPDTAVFLDKASPAYLGGILEMASLRLYRFWADLSEALKTGRPQNEAKSGGDFFTELYGDEQRLETFLSAMQGLQAGNHHALLERIDLSNVASLCDIGGANGALAALIAQRHPAIEVTTFDLPPVAPVATRHLTKAGLKGRVRVLSGDFFEDPWPQAEVLVLGNILHDWGAGQKRALIQQACRALPPGGRPIAIENVIDPDRRHNSFGLLMSLNMLIETEAGFDYTGADFNDWCTEAGFSKTEVVPLAGPGSAAIAYK